MKAKIHFLGGTGTVSGSKFLLETSKHQLLIDCGLFQGSKSLRLLNRAPLPLDYNKLSAVLITHAHLDHTGYLPVLIKNGYKGPVFMTTPTVALTEVILRDSAKIQMEEADAANQGNYSKHKPALPLYTLDEVEQTLNFILDCGENEWISLAKDIKFRFRKNGHILGSSFLEIDISDKKLIFSGDVGRTESLYLPSPSIPEQADILILESTYGNRLHSKVSPKSQLKDLINKTIQREGNIYIPCFAVGRALEIMLLIDVLKKENKIPHIPVVFDSPMGAEAIVATSKFPDWHKLNNTDLIDLNKETYFVRNIEETFSIIDRKKSKIVIAGSGMITGGRILHYLKAGIEDSNNLVILPGYQAEGTRGRALHDGEPGIKIMGKFYQVNAEIARLENISGHADQKELLNWIAGFRYKPKKVILIHGEKAAGQVLAEKINEKFGITVDLPDLNDIVEIN
ncbi:MBL fold metallo-hydrolase RNA specificity domain-containing protein [Sporocytophaga myxococcoides]|uniref:MBL fold metallo-hydrolase RNA specificity domain-containing protein n=1 Tax=Sporocytophaga myxococcoides TaxID=153721 RepID=UPI0003F67F0F|nr:MBL fold metallo-hydrolase [Sporocytophaga myxococcoides]